MRNIGSFSSFIIRVGILDYFSAEKWNQCRPLRTLLYRLLKVCFDFPGYEVHGLENIPDKGGALLIYYHGALPVDVYYMMGRLKTAKKRNLRNVVAEFMFYIPGQVLLRMILLWLFFFAVFFLSFLSLFFLPLFLLPIFSLSFMVCFLYILLILLFLPIFLFLFFVRLLLLFFFFVLVIFPFSFSSSFFPPYILFSLFSIPYSASLYFLPRFS